MRHAHERDAPRQDEGTASQFPVRLGLASGSMAPPSTMKQYWVAESHCGPPVPHENSVPVVPTSGAPPSMLMPMQYLGHPAESDAYERSSLLADAPRLERPLLLIHGLVDDNVVVAHTLRLSQALLEAGRPHSVLPLSGVTHMTPQEQVAENLLRVQVEFLRQHLGSER